MKCSFEEADFRPAWKAMLPPAANGDHLEAWDDPTWCDDAIRVEASNGTLKMQGPHGTASIPAEVQTPGVLFISIRYFISGLAPFNDDTTIHLEATEEYVDANHGRQMAQFVPMELFDDPATAPATFVPEVHEYEDEFGYGDDDEDDADLAGDEAAERL